MKPDFNITHILPNVDLRIWERCLNESDNLANLTEKETAIFLDPQSKPLHFRIGLTSNRPIGWKVVYVAQPQVRNSWIAWSICLGLVAILILVWLIT